jgi:UDP-glucose 4-epimerase
MSAQPWLLTGGAGYIGAHVAHALRRSGRQVTVLDDLSTGRVARLPAGVELVRASILDRDAVVEALRRYRIGGVIHLAGKKAVGESFDQPALYYRENVVGLGQLLAAMQAVDVHRMVFSSSAAVYGATDGPSVAEDAPTVPLSPYGWSKLAGEDLIRFTGQLTGLDWLSLRYFNVAGAGAPSLGDTTVSNLIPMAFRALDEGRAPQVFGDDYPTPDGTCIRDYIHVVDLAEAHVAAAARLERSQRSTGAVYNVGTGTGASVQEVLATVRAATGRPFVPDVVARRAGDPPAVVARVTAIERALGWRAERDLAAMVHSAWESWCFARQPQ